MIYLPEPDPPFMNEARFEVKADLFPLGTRSVIFTATDASGNMATCSRAVSVVDTIAPTLSLPDRKSVV